MRNILVVEDNIDLQFLYERALKQEGYRVQKALNGKQALDGLKDGSLNPDLIILDLMMPVMDGHQFLRERDQDSKIKNIPVVVCTASMDQDLAIEDRYCLRKPVDLHLLLRLIEKSYH